MSEKSGNIAASVRQRLLNLARERGDEFQFVLTRYAIERLLYRLSRSKHADQFTVKGATLFQLWTGHPHRSTLDLDLLGTGPDAISRFESIFREVFVEVVEPDGLVLPADSIKGEEIREDQKYGGVRIRGVATLEKALIPLQIDIGIGDAVTPKAVTVEFPTLLSMPSPKLKAYPKETVVAEKFEAMVSLGITNSRMKDFYDLWMLSTRFDFNGANLLAAVTATFGRRGTVLPSTIPVALTIDFAEDAAKQNQWTAFVRRGKLAVATPPLVDVIRFLAAFLEPVRNAAVSGKRFDAAWLAGGPWT